MKKFITFFKVMAFILFAALAISGCGKSSTVDQNTIYTPEREATLIKNWLDSVVANKIIMDTTSTGLIYIKGKIGTGPTVKAEDVVTVKYSGKFLNGKVFDASAYYNEAGTLTYIHKAPTASDRSMIQGWEEGIEVLNKGASAAFLIPSYKAYGSTGSSPTIPPYSPLVFVIEVVSIK